MSVMPTTQGRAPTLDLIRGVAILGILLANLVAFSEPSLASMMSGAPAESGMEGWIQGVTAFLVNGKFRSMLAILFGVGLYLQFRKRESEPNGWPGGYLKRNFFLGLIGVIHGVFIWYGDILTAYSLCAFVACFMVRLPDRRLMQFVVAGFALSFLAGVGLMALMMFLPTPTEELGGFFSATAETRAFAEGTYGNQIAYRGIAYGLSLMMIPMYFLFVLPLFLAGIVLARSGFFLRPSAHPRILKCLLGLGLGVGLPLNAVSLALVPAGLVPKYQFFLEFFGGPLLSLGYLGLLAWCVERFGAWKPLANVGKLALTSYLSQSVLMTFTFYSFGLGWFGSASLAQKYGAILAVWVFNLVFASLWLRRFDIGPVEWVLRSLTEGKKLPWKYPPKPAATFQV